MLLILAIALPSFGLVLDISPFTLVIQYGHPFFMRIQGKYDNIGDEGQDGHYLFTLAMKTLSQAFSGRGPDFEPT